LEGELFLLGHWKNYEDLESSLSMPEIINTFKAMQKTEEEKRRFLASLQGINLDGDNKEDTAFDDIRRRAMGIEANGDDIVSLQGVDAHSAGFGIGMGIGYSKG
jgi:hypothetical protein